MKKAFLIPVLLVLTLGAFAQDGSMMKSTKPAADASGMKAVDSSAYAVDGLGPQVKPFTTEKDAWALAKVPGLPGHLPGHPGPLRPDPFERDRPVCQLRQVGRPQEEVRRDFPTHLRGGRPGR